MGRSRNWEGLGWLGALAASTVAIACALVAGLGIGTVPASFLAAFLVVLGLGLYGAVYQHWARSRWGAPFEIGDRVRIVRGPGAGREAIVVQVGQGVTVEVELDAAPDEAPEAAGRTHRISATWAALRRDTSTRDTSTRRLHQPPA